jgi:hypothetical protein
MTKMASHCQICRRELALDDDPLSIDCGGDCWGCIGPIEAELGDVQALERVRAEFARGLRPGWTEPTKLLD